jgi:hypothetical protein
VSVPYRGPPAKARASDAFRSLPPARTRRCRFIERTFDCMNRAINSRRHSITSSARPSNVGGKVMPSALAVLRLMTNSTFVICWTGRSAGLSPLRIRPV